MATTLEQDTVAAKKWMLKSADGGSTEAMYWLAMLYLDDGLDGSEVEAKKWLAKAVRMGHLQSEIKLKEISSEAEMIEREFDLFNLHRSMRAAESSKEPVMRQVDHHQEWNENELK